MYKIYLLGTMTLESRKYKTRLSLLRRVHKAAKDFSLPIGSILYAVSDREVIPFRVVSIGKVKIIY